jgi:hypothetical protein
MVEVRDIFQLKNLKERGTLVYAVQNEKRLRLILISPYIFELPAVFRAELAFFLVKQMRRVLDVFGGPFWRAQTSPGLLKKAHFINR